MIVASQGPPVALAKISKKAIPSDIIAPSRSPI